MNKVLKMSPNHGSCLLELLTLVCESELAGAQVKWACREMGKEPMSLTDGGPSISSLWKLGPLPQLSPRRAAASSIMQSVWLHSPLVIG